MFHLLSDHPRRLIFPIAIATGLFTTNVDAAPFKVYEHILYGGKPTAEIQSLMSRLPYVRGGDLFTAAEPKDSAARCDGPSLGPTSLLANEARKEGAGFVILDIEERCLKPKFATSPADLENRIDIWIGIINAWHQYAPGSKVTFYSEPARNWLAAKAGENSQAMTDWRVEVAKLSRMFAAMDWFTPSLYLFGNEKPVINTYVKTMLQETRKYAGSKPIVGYMWTDYHQSTYPDTLAGDLIPGDIWRYEMDKIRQYGGNGLIVWTQPEPWPGNSAGWWTETKNFIATLDNTSPTQGSPGTLQFSASSYSVNEGNNATIIVTRTDGGSGGVSVDFNTADSTATEGADYLYTAGSLTFAAGATASKTFTIPIMEDSDVEDTEIVNLSLSNLDGDATLGPSKTATLSIIDKSLPSGETCAEKALTITGTSKDDTIYGTNGPDVIAGLGGSDEIRSKDGADIICGGDGNDQLQGGFGNDQLFGNAGDDRLDGRDDTDTCDGGNHRRGDLAINCERVKNVP